MTAADEPPPPPPPPPGDHLVIRRWRTDDPLPPLTALLHRAYAPQVAMGLRPLAGRQDDATTRRRCASGECFLALIDDAPVGIIVFHEVEPDEAPPFFKRPGVDYFSMLAVDPRFQGRGIGARLLEHVEARATAAGTSELALSMAEPDTALRDWYLKRGYRVVGLWKWPYTNYQSLVMSKTLRSKPAPA